MAIQILGFKSKKRSGMALGHALDPAVPLFFIATTVRVSEDQLALSGAGHSRNARCHIAATWHTIVFNALRQSGFAAGFASSAEISSFVDLQRPIRNIAGDARGPRNNDGFCFDVAFQRTRHLNDFTGDCSPDYGSAAYPHPLSTDFAFDRTFYL
jgi:hypothetical protein